MDGGTISTSDGTPRESEPAPGRRVGEYILEEPIGEGGFGTVWRARHAVLPGKTVAIKLPRDRELIEILRRESILQHGLDHPGVLQVLGVDLDAPLPYIVQEYAAGGDLASHLARQKKISAERALAIFREIVVVVAAAHARGVIHRDLKPSNVLLDEQGRVRVADFGLGRGLAALTSSALRQSVRSLDSFADRRLDGGTWDYMSPEQRQVASAGDDFADVEIVDARADVWALGIILYELLEGRRPAGRVGLAHVSGAVDRIFARCWTELSERYTDARELLVELDRARGKKRRQTVDPAVSRKRAEEPDHAPVETTEPSRHRSSRSASHSASRSRARYSPLTSLWHRVMILVPSLVILAAVFVIWLNDRDLPLPAADPLPIRSDLISAGELSEDEAVRLGEIRRTIEQHPQDETGAVALLNAFIAAADDPRLRERALEWRESIESSSSRREYQVRWRGFAIDREAYGERFHSALEPGSPDVYIRVFHKIDGEEERVFDSSKTAVEAWTHVWKTSGKEEVPSFRLRWAKDDGIRIEMREADVLHDNTVAEYRVDGGLSILLLSGTRASPEGHRLVFDSDFLFGD